MDHIKKQKEVFARIFIKSKMLKANAIPKLRIIQFNHLKVFSYFRLFLSVEIASE